MKLGGHMTDETRAKISATMAGRPAQNRGVSLSPETRAKMSAARMGNKNSLGCHRSEANRTSISAGMMGKTNSLGTHHSDETKAKMSVAHMGNTNCLGCHHSEETKARMSVAQTGRVASPETRAKLSLYHRGLPSGSLSLSWKGGQAIARRKFKAKRRTLGFVPMNTYFEGCEGHHLDRDRVVYIPRDLHRSIRHNQWTGKNMEQINALALSFIGGGNA